MCSAWEDHKETIRGYWIDDNKRLEEVVHIMKVKYNFDKTYDKMWRHVLDKSTYLLLGKKHMKPSSQGGGSNSRRNETQSIG
jgi:hypothetical protein